MDDVIRFDPSIDGGVVAGVDGSPAGCRVLSWGWAEAAAHGWSLHVVRAWSVAEAAGRVGTPFGIVPSLQECADSVVADTHRQLDAVRGQPRGPGAQPAVFVHVVHARPDEALLAAARHAQLLVVGHRGHGRMALVLGSVTEQVLQNAPCPVVVLPLS